MNLLRLHQGPFTLWITDLGGKLVYDAKRKRKGKKLLFWTSVKTIPEQIFNKTPLKISIHVPNLPRRTSEIIQDTHEYFSTF